MSIGYINGPFLKIDYAIIFYGLFQWGSKIEPLFMRLFFWEKSNDFEEMILHDCVTVFCF